jgi:hypothetical protein
MVIMIGFVFVESVCIYLIYIYIFDYYKSKNINYRNKEFIYFFGKFKNIWKWKIILDIV